MGSIRGGIIRVVGVFFLYNLSIALFSPLIALRVLELEGGDIAAGSGDDDRQRDAVSRAAEVTGWLAAANAFATFVVSSPLGVLSDRIGRRPFMIVSLAACVVDTLVLAGSPYIWPLFISRSIAGLFNSAFVMAFSMLADLSTPETRAQAFGLVYVAFGGGFAAGALLGGWLARVYGLTLAFLFAGAIALVGVVVAAIFLDETALSVTSRSKKGERKPADDESRALLASSDIPDPPPLQPTTLRDLNPFRSITLLRQSRFASWMAMIYFLVFLSEEGLTDTFVLFIKVQFGWGPLLIGFFIALFGVTLVLVQGGIIRIVIPRLFEERTLLLCLVVDFVSVPFYGAIPRSQSWLLFPLFAVRSFALMTGPALQGMISKEFAAAEQGTVLGLIGALKTCTAFIGPLVFNQVRVPFVCVFLRFFPMVVTKLTLEH
jgi:MFS transporter, DHA1 family, tetracycline resistance protein